ncbi:MAG: response regulator transcription factor, partial [Deltaproteobacteria bacterium]|nr:response regulator transcription factor [Deltaproteobacteria bacterium]
ELLIHLKEDEPDLLILDISMPPINGIDLTGKIKRMYPALKILILTMHTNKQFFYRALSVGADGYLVKSDSDNELLKAIKKISAGRTYISPLLTDDFTEDALNAYRDHKTNPFKGLTTREHQILGLVVEGYTSKAMAKKLNLSPRTVDHHRSSLLRKFNMRNSVDLVKYAIRNGHVEIK